MLADIEGYNHYDCRSTRELRDWLWARAGEHDVTYRQPPVPKDKTQDPIDEDETACALQEFAGDELAERTVDHRPSP